MRRITICHRRSPTSTRLRRLLASGCIHIQVINGNRMKLRHLRQGTLGNRTSIRRIPQILLQSTIPCKSTYRPSESYVLPKTPTTKPTTITMVENITTIPIYAPVQSRERHGTKRRVVKTRNYGTCKTRQRQHHPT